MSDINLSNKITIPVTEVAAGQRVIKIVKDDKATFFSEGLGGRNGGSTITTIQAYTPVVDHVYYHDVYDTVCYLDADNSITSAGYTAVNISLVDLWICQLDAEETPGNIVLQCGDNTFVLPVTPELVKRSLKLTKTVSGTVSIVRKVDDARDTFAGTVIAADWQVA